MNCKRAQELISIHLDAQLDPAGQSRLNGHLEDCPECTRYLADLQEGLAILRELPLSEPSANFDWNLRLKLQQAQNEPWRHREEPANHGYWPRFVMSAAAALLLTLGGGYAAYNLLQAPTSPPRILTPGPQANESLDIPTLPQPYPGMGNTGNRELQVVGQGESQGNTLQERGTIQRTEPGNSMPPLGIRDHEPEGSDSLSVDSAPDTTPAP